MQDDGHLNCSELHSAKFLLSHLFRLWCSITEMGTPEIASQNRGGCAARKAEVIKLFVLRMTVPWRVRHGVRACDSDSQRAMLTRARLGIPYLRAI